MENPSNSSSATNSALSIARAEEDERAFRQFHDEAYLYASHALAMEQESESKGALLLYERALRLIDQALSMNTEGPTRTGETWDKIRMAQMKMRHTRLQILERLMSLRTVKSPNNHHLPTEESPPSYDEATNNAQSTCTWSRNHANEGATSKDSKNGESEVRRSFHEKVSEMAEAAASSSSAADGVNSSVTEIPATAEAIFTLPEVQLFFVSPDGFVSAPSYPTSLTVYKYTKSEGVNSAATGWLEVGSWIYPLIPGRSPVLQTNYGAYMLPDVNLQQPGAAVGLLLPDTLDEEIRMIFENLLYELTAVRLQGTTITVEDVLAEEARLSRRISAGIIKGAEVLAKGVYYGSEITSKLVHQGASTLRQRINPSNNPPDVDPRVQKSLQMARQVTGAAVSVSSFVVRRVGEATLALGRFVAPHIRRQGSLLLSKALREDPKTVNYKVDDVLEVAAGGLKGIATVYVSLESAARLLASSLANETVQIVHYRYGGVVGDVTDNAVRAVGNVAMTAYNLNTMGVKGIAKRTATCTGKALVEDFEQRKGQPESHELKPMYKTDKEKKDFPPPKEK